MKLRLRLAPLAVFALVLLIGAAFIKQGIQQRDAQRRLAAIEAADRVGAALEREAKSAFDTLRRWADTREAVKDMAPAEMMAIVGNGHVRDRTPDVPLPVDVEDLARDAGADSAWIPVRGTSGEPKVVARIALQPGIYAAAVIDLNRLLGSVGLLKLSQSGIDYRLTAARAKTGAALARSTDAELERASLREIWLGGERWTLAVAPSGARVQWPPVLLHALITLVLAFAVALAVNERSHEDGVLRDTLAVREERLREATQRLTEEVEQRAALEKQFSNASFHDAQTGLPNRRFLVSRLEAWLRRARTGTVSELAIAIFALERIKVVSDSLGLAVADELVMQAARRFEAALDGAAQVVGRLHDSQFACVLSGLESRGAVTQILERLQASLAEPFMVAGHTLYVTTRAGVAFSTSGYDHAEDLVRNAHIALTQAKGQHSRVVVFDPGTQEQVVSRHQLERDLHGVAERGELRLNYQPIVSLASGEIAGFEALLRWHHPLEGVIPPGMFIQLAEETGLIVPMTRWVLREACRQARAWRAELAPERQFYVSVNLSAHDMRQPDMGDFVASVITESGLPAGALRLEVTEGSMIDNMRDAVELITRFRQMGAQILLDDFGTGYSSLAYLNRFPIDYIKIDQSFVGRMTPDAKSSGIVRAILYLAEAMEIKTIAEGIETAEAMHQLIELDCDYGQGYYFSKPVEADAAWKLLVSRPVWGRNSPAAKLSISIA